jgi:hypothetical protein
VSETSRATVEAFALLVAERVYEACWRAEGFRQEPFDWSVPLSKIAREAVDELYRLRAPRPPGSTP